MAIDDSSNIYITGSFSNIFNIGGQSITTSGLWNMYVAKYDKNGNLKWVQTGTCSGNEQITGKGIGIDGLGNVYVSGNYNATVATFNNQTLNSDGGKIFT